MSAIRFESGTDGIAMLTLEAGRDIEEFARDLATTIDRISEPEIRGAVMTAVEGASFLDGLYAAAVERGAAEALRFGKLISALYRRLETCGKPLVAAINGPATGAGFELALACHGRVIAGSAGAVVGFPDMKLGLIPCAGGTQRLPRLIGISKALPLLLEGHLIGPAEAHRLGIADSVAAPDRLIEQARELARARSSARQPWDIKGYLVPGGAGCLAPHSTESFQITASRMARATSRNYPAPIALLSCVFEGTQLPIDGGLSIESKYLARVLAHSVTHNLVRTLHVAKRAADGLARRPVGFPKSDVAQLAVLGAGMMGAGIAHVAASAGIEVILLDVTMEQAERGKQYSAKILERVVQKEGLTKAQCDAVLARIRPATDYANVAGCEFAIEAVFEARDVKRAVVQKAEAALPASAVFASNTSTLPISGLAKASQRPGQFIGLHFFSPVERMPLVEVIVGTQTSDATVARALDFIAQLRKTPIVVSDSPGFYTSRIFMAYIDEGMAMLAEGVAPALIENAARMAGMPVGPLAVTDEVTLDLQLHVIEQNKLDRLPSRFRRLHAQKVIRKMVRLGRRGRRSGAGFYEYPAGGAKRLWHGLAEHFPVKARQPEAETVKQRLLLIQSLEAARCTEEGVITSPADADLGSILGVGFPSWTGGTLSYIEMLGPEQFVADCQDLATRYGSRFQPSRKMLARAQQPASFPAAGDRVSPELPKGFMPSRS